MPLENGGTLADPLPPIEVPIWEGEDIVVSEEVRIVGPNGEKVDSMTFRGSFEKDIMEFAKIDKEFSSAVENEDDEVIESILQERFFHKSEMFYSLDKLVLSYGVPAILPHSFMTFSERKRFQVKMMLYQTQFPRYAQDLDFDPSKKNGYMQQ